MIELINDITKKGKEKRSISSKSVLSRGVMSCATSELRTVPGPARRPSPGADAPGFPCFK